MPDLPLYFDIAATTPIDRDVANLINTINLENFGNPSSIHSFGQKSHNIIEKSRKKISEILKCNSSEIYFTSGGSESNNIVLKGILSPGDHFITSSYEHPSVLGLTDELENNNIKITLIKPNNHGVIEAKKIEDSIRENTKLISIMYVNNELGTINPINDIGEIAYNNNILFHSDAVQALGKIPLNLGTISADFISMSAHKLYGPKGVGALFIRKGSTLKPLIYGGKQEYSLRASTENIAGIGGFGMAVELATMNLTENSEHITHLENHFIRQLDEKKIDYTINGDQRIPGVLNMTFPKIDGQNLVIHLDMAGIGISFGAACSSGTAKASSMLMDLGLTKMHALSTVRISLGKMHSIDDVKKVVDTIHQILLQKREEFIDHEG